MECFLPFALVFNAYFLLYAGKFPVPQDQLCESDVPFYKYFKRGYNLRQGPGAFNVIPYDFF